jgi:ATP-dependent DNA ligase
MYRHRLARTYHTTPESARTGAHFFEPMLAQHFKAKHFRPGDMVQAKYDGARNVGSASGNISRAGKPFLSVPHLNTALNQLLDKEPDFMGDGELYGVGLSRQKIMSLIKKTKNITPFDLEQSAKHVRWYLYDLPSLGHLPFIDRWRKLMEYTRLFPELFAGPDQELAPDARPFIVVPTYTVQTLEQYTGFHANCIARKLEGSIYRKADALYENKRSWGLLKRKDWMDDEFEVLGANEGNGNWAGAAKTLTCRALPLSAPDYGPDNPLYHKLFYPTTTGSHGQNAELLARVRAGEIPHSATVKYFDKSMDGVPQHVNAIDIWWEPRDV